MEIAYLDHASTTPPHPAALEALARASRESWADPSRLYGEARRARIALDDARAVLASTVGGRAEEIVLTSGGTESCNLAVRAAALAAEAARRPKRILVSAVEHTAVLRAAHAMERDGFEIVEIPVDGSGTIRLDELERACEAGGGVVCVQHANHEVGTIQPVAEAAAIARARGAIVHTDACMTVGHVPVDVRALGVDLLSASSHKAYGPRGAGLLWARRGVRVRPQAVGDDRERGRRAGMENLPAIAGFAAALAARAGEIEEEQPRLRAWTERIRREVQGTVPGALVLGDPDRSLPGLAAFGLPDVDAEALLLALDAKGIAVHAGSSCVSTPEEPSHVLAAMGAPVEGSVRVSLGRKTTAAHVDSLLRELPGVVERVRGTRR